MFHFQRRFLLTFTFPLCLALAAGSACAGTIDVVPPDLAPGTEYRLIFVTSGTYAVNSNNISTYNADVANEAASISALSSLNTTWSAVVSTASVAAISNVQQDTGVEIYNLAGMTVAQDAGTAPGSLFGGSLSNPIDISPNGSQSSGNVATGSSAMGTAYFPLGGAIVEAGVDSHTSGLWAQDMLTMGNGLYQIYGISGVLTVPALSVSINNFDSSPAPEPGSLFLLAAAGILLAFRSLPLRRRRI